MWRLGNLLAVLLALALSSAQATSLIQALQDAGASQFAALIQSDPDASAVYFSSQVQTVFAPIDGATNSSISKLRRRQSSPAALQRKLYQSTSNTNTLGSMSSGSGLAMMSNEKSAKLGGKRQVFVSNPLNKTISRVVKRWDDDKTKVTVPTTVFVTVPTTALVTLLTTVHDIDFITVHDTDLITVSTTELITLVTTVHDIDLTTVVTTVLTTVHDIDVTTVINTVQDIDLTSVLTTVHEVDLITSTTSTTDITTVHDTALITVTTTELISVPVTVATTLLITVITTVQNTEFVTVPSTLLTTVVTTVPTTVLTTVPTTLVTTVPTTLLTTVLNSVQNTELITVPTTLLTTVLTTVQNTQLVTVPTTLLTVVPTTVLVTVPTQVPTTVSTIVLTSVLTTVRTTVFTTVHTTVTTKVPPTALPSLLQISSGLGNTVNIIQGDIPYDGGLIHIVDDYFTLPESLTDTANANGQTAFTGLASSYSLTDTFDNTQQITCFIPTNAALAMPGSTSNYSSIQNLLLGHMIPNFVGYLPSLSNGTTYRSQSGTTFTVTIQGSDYYINNAKILTSNVIVDNGVAHVIDQVIQPTKPTPTGAPSSASSLRGGSLQFVMVVWSIMLFLATGFLT